MARRCNGEHSQMKNSTALYAELQAVLQRIRGLNDEAEACQRSTRNWRLSAAEEKENARRGSRLYQISAEITKESAAASKLRREYSLAMADEQAPRPAAPAKSAAEIPKLQKQIAEAEASIANLSEQRRPHVVAAARGDKKAIAALDQIAAIEDTALNKIEIAKAAISEIETEAAEERREFLERSADMAFAGAQSAGEDIAAIAHNIDLAERSLSELYRQWEERLRSIRKTGASFDDARLNVLQSVEIRHRSAKAAGLAAVYGISVRDAVPLEDATRTLLKLAIRRPEIKGKAAA
jgi:hypothetical protein